MEPLTLVLPALYGDHHIPSVRRVLDAMPGVSTLRVSPASHTVQLEFDPSRQTAAAIERALAAGGYIVGDPDRALSPVGPAAPRHTATLGETLAFTHQPPAWEGRPLWPCPGFTPAPIPEN